MGAVNDVGGIARSSAVCVRGDRRIMCFGISPYHSNAMKSDNPHSGIYVAETARTLDNMNCGYPGCNQGGICVVEIHR